MRGIGAASGGCDGWSSLTPPGLPLTAPVQCITQRQGGGSTAGVRGFGIPRSR